MHDSDIVLDDSPTALHFNQGIARSEHMRTVTVSNLADLIPHVAPWDQLAWNSSPGIPCLLPAWVESFLRYRLQPNERWLCSFAYVGEHLVGVLPVVIMPHPVLGRGWPVLRTVSDKLTPSSDVLLAPSHAEEALRALLDEICRQEPTHLGIDIIGVRSGSLLWRVPSIASDNYVRIDGKRSMYSFLDVQGDFDRYVTSLGNMRRNLKRFRKKLENQGTVSLEVHKGSPAAEQFLAEFLALEAGGWKGRNGTAMMNNPSAVSFYSELARSLSSHERMEWYALRVQDRLVAAQMCIRCGAMLMLAKIAFDEKFSDCRPGHLLTGEVFKDAFARSDIEEINHLSNADPEGSWRLSYDEYLNVHLVRKQLLPALFQLPIKVSSFAYQNYARPRIPAVLKKAYRSFRRRGDRRPLRSADSRSARDA
jgi:CelD/BcsL family acetyltransferase involved in cellulose biosynthesis